MMDSRRSRVNTFREGGSGNFCQPPMLDGIAVSRSSWNKSTGFPALGINETLALTNRLLPAVLLNNLRWQRRFV
jgi:hypothetical protein